MEQIKLNVFEEGEKYWLRLHDGEHYTICVKENQDHTYTFREDNKELIVAAKDIVKYLKL